VYLENVAESALPAGWQSVDLENAEIAIVRVAAPFEHRDDFFLESGMQQGSLTFPDAEIDHLVTLGQQVPLILVVTLNRPAILGPLVDATAALIGEFGVSDEVLLRVLTGEVAAEGRLPYEIPKDMRAVESAQPDTPNDTLDPLFPVGWGLGLNLPVSDSVSAALS
jgi:beta-glucosidase